MWPGAYRGVVLSSADPAQAGRVRLQVPQVTGDAPTGWVPPAQTGASVPAVGTVVWVMYLAGDASYPLYIPPAPPPYVPPAEPAWQVQASPTVGGMTLGNGTIGSQYLVRGHTVRWALAITWGSTTTASPTAAITVPVPVVPDPGSSVRWVGNVMINPAGGSSFRSGGAWLFPGSSSISIEAQRASDLGYAPFSTISLSMATGGWVAVNIEYDKA